MQMLSVNIDDAAETVINTMAMLLFVGGALAMYIKPPVTRLKTILGSVMLFWGASYLLRMVWMFNGGAEAADNFMPAWRIDTALIYSVSLLLYPIEVQRPGWLSWKRSAYILAPTVAIMAFILLVPYIVGPYQSLPTIASVCHRASDFDVWIRLAALGSVFVMYCISFYRTVRTYIVYRKWCRTTGSVPASKIFLLGLYFVGVLLLDIGLVWWAVFPSLSLFLLGTVAALILFCCLLYYTTVSEYTYPAGFVRQLNAPVHSSASTQDIAAEIERWFDEKHPYRNINFKLSDVAHHFVMDSKQVEMVFPEIFGKSFIEYIRDRRLDDALVLLVECPDISVSEVSRSCGISNISSFHRTFLAREGVTPREYRVRELRKHRPVGSVPGEDSDVSEAAFSSDTD